MRCSTERCMYYIYIYIYIYTCIYTLPELVIITRLPHLVSSTNAPMVGDVLLYYNITSYNMTYYAMIYIYICIISMQINIYIYIHTHIHVIYNVYTIYNVCIYIYIYMYTYMIYNSVRCSATSCPPT